MNKNKRINFYAIVYQIRNLQFSINRGGRCDCLRSMPAAARLNILGSQLNNELVEYSSGGIDKDPRVPQR